MMETINAYKFYVKPGKTDLRKRATSLSFIVQCDMKLLPFEKSVFVFCNGSHSTIRAIVWDRNGWFEISKRLEAGTFCWPNDEAEALSVTVEQLVEVLYGGNPWRRFPVLSPTDVC